MKGLAIALVLCACSTPTRSTPDDIVLELNGPDPNATYGIGPEVRINGLPTDVTTFVPMKRGTRVRFHYESGVWHVVPEPAHPTP